MEKDEIVEAGVELSSLPPSTLVVAAAINGNRKSKYVVRWALDKFISEGNLTLKLFHVRPRITSVPTPMGNFLPVSQVRDDIATAYKQEVEWQKSKVLLPYTRMCALRKVQADVMMIEADDVADAIAGEVAKGGITKLVIGAPSRSLFTRRIKKNNLSSRISGNAPSSCTIYAVSRGKLSSIRPSDLETIGSRSIRDSFSEISYSTQNSSRHTPRWLTHSSSVACHAPSRRSFSQRISRFKPISAIKQFVRKSSSTTRCTTLCTPAEKGVSRSSSTKSYGTDKQSWISGRASILDGANWSNVESEVGKNSQLDHLKVQLRHVRGLYAVAQNEAVDASRKLDTLDKRRVEESMKLQGISSKEETSKEIARQEKERCEAARREAEKVNIQAEREALQRREVEMKAIQQAKEKERLENALSGRLEQYQKFTWEEIESATSSFSDDLKIGFGAHGTVYKCSLHHIKAAVKVLHSLENQNIQQELEILGKIRHPHLLILLGTCIDRGCLVYEYMENGSLEERLFRKNDTPAIPWFERYRIAWEIASALVYLHNSKPNPIIHRDLKPANILLDINFVSKIGDIGLSTMIDSDTCSNQNTGPVGTMCYLDPEYQRTGEVSPKCDVYAFGMVILQLLTAKPAMALAYAVESAIEDEKFEQILDSEAGDWPIEETKELALLGLKCSELQRKDRPDLKDQVLPVLEKLREFASKTQELNPESQSAPPNHFICPILKDVMEDPCVAADGYTYERKVIEKWFQQNDESPMTNLRLQNKNLLPNYNLLCAITEWKSRKRSDTM